MQGFDDLGAAARQARALADETRLRILTALLEGEATVSDLAARLGLPQPRVSSHLAVLRDAGIAAAATAGRQRAYRVEAARVRPLLAALHRLAGGAPRSAQATREVRHNTALRQARTCYDHLAGLAGVQLLDQLLARGWVEQHDEGARPAYRLTPSGRAALAARGVDLTSRSGSRRGFAFGCLDWTERRPHLGGALGAAVLRALVDTGAVGRAEGSRAVTVYEPPEAWLDRVE